MKYHQFLVRKYLTSRLIPLAGIFAMAFGVFALFVTLAVMEGFRVEMRDRIRGTLSHIRVEGPVYLSLQGEDETLAILRRQPHVVAVAPYVDGQAMFKASHLDFCRLYGVDPQAEAEVGDFGKLLLRDDEWLALLGNDAPLLPDDRPALSKEEIAHLFSLERRRGVAKRAKGIQGLDLEYPPPPIVVGIQMVKHRLMYPGQVVQLLSYTGIDPKATSRNFLVVGVFMTGLTEYDAGAVYMPIRAAQEFLGLYDEEADDYRLGGVSVRLDDYSHAEDVRREFENRVIPQLPGGDGIVRTWEDQRRNLLRAVEVEKKILYVMFLLLVLFASTIIFVILWLMVIEKTRDLGVLASLGAPPAGVVRVFVGMGMVLCVLGAAVGLGLGWLFTENINGVHAVIYRVTGWQLFPPDIYYLTEIPVVYTRGNVLVILLPALVFGLLGSLIPAILAARRDPIGALRHE